MTLTLNESNQATAELKEGATTSKMVGSVPFTLWSTDTFYWTHQWQQDEAETLADTEGVVFDSDDPEDAAKWLRADED